MPRVDKWLPFFEKDSEKRDVASWWTPIEEKVLKWGMQITGLVSDRASALEKLGTSAYLNVISMPDLFHFTQDLGKLAGLRIGKKREQAKKAVTNASESEKAALTADFEQVDKVYQKYRQQIQQVNKTVHPFNEQDDWRKKGEVEKGLLQCLTSIGGLMPQLGMEVVVEKATKVLKQIAPISQGVEAWITRTKIQITDWVNNQIINQQEQKWLISCALPYVYWQIQLNRTQAKLRNHDLRIYYKQRLEKAKQNGYANELTQNIAANRQEELLLMAHKLAISFQRASSQTEGRNGYLAFVNHAHKGFPKGRLEILTVIHNYDIKRKDGTTPAKRLFGKDFPDLFEFLCQNVTGFKEPRARKNKSFNISTLQR